MASLVNRPRGHKWISFYGLDRRHRTVRLGKATKQQGLAFKDRIERLLAAKAMGLPPDLELSRWAGSLSDTLYRRVAATGLLEQREQAATLANLLEAFWKALDVEPTTARKLRWVAGRLVNFWGDSRPVATITEADAMLFRTWLSTEGGKKGGPLAQATVSRQVRRASQILGFAVRKKWIASDPFCGMSGNEVNRKRDHYVELEDIDRILDAIPSLEFRVIVCLARYGGLRCPSEILRLTWHDVHWDDSMLRVESPKNARHASAVRLVPLCPELRGAIEELWDAAPEGATVLLPKHQVSGFSLTRRLYFACDRAGVPRWKKPWQNMCGTRESELLDQGYSIQDVTSWLGHSPTVAVRHYTQVSKEHVARVISVRTSRKAKLNPKRSGRIRTDQVIHPDTTEDPKTP